MARLSKRRNKSNLKYRPPNNLFSAPPQLFQIGHRQRLPEFIRSHRPFRHEAKRLRPSGKKRKRVVVEFAANTADVRPHEERGLVGTEGYPPRRVGDNAPYRNVNIRIHKRHILVETEVPVVLKLAVRRLQGQNEESHG